MELPDDLLQVYSMLPNGRAAPIIHLEDVLVSLGSNSSSA